MNVDTRKDADRHGDKQKDSANQQRDFDLY